MRYYGVKPINPTPSAGGDPKLHIFFDRVRNGIGESSYIIPEDGKYLILAHGGANNLTSTNITIPSNITPDFSKLYSASSTKWYGGLYVVIADFSAGDTVTINTGTNSYDYSRQTIIKLDNISDIFQEHDGLYASDTSIILGDNVSVPSSGKTLVIAGSGGRSTTYNVTPPDGSTVLTNGVMLGDTWVSDIEPDISNYRSYLFAGYFDVSDLPSISVKSSDGAGAFVVVLS